MTERQIVELARELPVDLPNPDEARRLESQLFIRAQLTPQYPAQTAPRRSRAIWAVAASVVFTMLVGRAIWTTDRVDLDDAPHGVVRATEGASFERELRSIGGNLEEIVQLEHGTLFVRVRKLRPGDRFLVRTGESEVEVRGTRFEVSAVRGRLVRVAVEEGRVEVRPKSDLPRMLLPGDVWHQTRFARPTRWARAPGPTPEVRRKPGLASSLPPVVPDAPAASAELPGTPSPSEARIDVLEELIAAKEKPRVAEEKRERPPPVRPRLPRQDVEAAFLRAWQMHKRGQFDQAAEIFMQVIENGDEHDIVEDASYWRTVALEHGGHVAKAIEAAETYVRRFPAAARREAIELRWAWLEFGRGNSDRAREHFTRLLGSSKETVRQEAREGLERMSRPPEEKWLDE